MKINSAYLEKKDKGKLTDAYLQFLDANGIKKECVILKLT
jgi:hypothetical protein